VRVVVDSNVWVSGLIDPHSPPGHVLTAVLERRLEVVSSWELVDEVSAILERPKLQHYEFDASDMLDLLRTVAITLPTVDVDVEIRDPADAPVVAAAVAGRAEAIVTGDADLLEDAELRRWLDERGVRVLTARKLVDELG
jgi:putative PIN family toxin of toxin-antitoxin system